MSLCVSFRKPALVGREGELQALKYLLDASTMSKGGLVFVAGEAGIGKTRITNELRSYAEGKGVIVLSGRCLYHEGSDPYLPFVDALRSYLAKKSERPFEGIASVGLSGGFAPQNKDFDINRERDRMFETVTQFIISIASDAPLALFLDDLQWADGSTLQLLHYLNRNITESRVLICGTYRPEDLNDADGKTHPLKEALKRMSRDRLYTTITLKRLSKEDSSEMIASMLSEKVDDELAEFVHRKAEGNPFFIEEILRALFEEGLFKPQDGKRAWKFDDSIIAIPSTIKDLVTRRIDRLSKDAMRAVECAAAIGREFTFDVLQKATEIDEETLLDAIDELIDAKIVREEARHGIERYLFDHTSIREVIYDNFSSGKRRLVHKKIGLALESLSKGKLDGATYALAYHFSASGDAERTAKYSANAGARAKDSFAPGEAIGYYTQALNAFERMPDGPTTRKGKMETLEALAKLCLFTSDWQGGISHCGALAVIAAEEKDERTLASAKLLEGHMRQQRNEWAEARKAFAETIEIAERIGEKHIEGDAYRGLGRIYWMQGNYASALDNYNRAAVAASQSGDMRVLASTNIDLGNAYGDSANWKKCYEHYEKAIALLEKLGDEYELARAYNNLAVSYQEAGESERALILYEKCVATSERSKNMKYLAHGLDGIGEILASKNENEDAIKNLDRSIAIARRIGDRYLLAGVLHAYGAFRGRLKEYDKASAIFEESIAILEELNIQRHLAMAAYEYALVLREMGRTSDADAHVKKAIEIFSRLGFSSQIEKINAEYYGKKA